MTMEKKTLKMGGMMLFPEIWEHTLRYPKKKTFRNYVAIPQLLILNHQL